MTSSSPNKEKEKGIAFISTFFKNRISIFFSEHQLLAVMGGNREEMLKLSQASGNHAMDISHILIQHTKVSSILHLKYFTSTAIF